MTVEARAIEFTIGSRKLKADTKVRSSMLPQSSGRGQAAAKPGTDRTQPAGRNTAGDQGRNKAVEGTTQTHVPSLLQQDQPVTVTSNRLEDDGLAGHAVYIGNSRLWQGATKVNGDTIIVDDKTGNLEARTNVHTEMMMDDVDPQYACPKSDEFDGRIADVPCTMTPSGLRPTRRRRISSARKGTWQPKKSNSI